MGIPFPRVGGSFTLDELEAKARELHAKEQAASAQNAVAAPAVEEPANIETELSE